MLSNFGLYQNLYIHFIIYSLKSQTIIKVCIDKIFINNQQIRTTQDQTGFRFNKYHESCEENDEMATSMIIIQNGIITKDFCSVNKRLLFNGNISF